MRTPLRAKEIEIPGFGRLDIVDQSRSTNTELVAAVAADPAAWPAPSALVAEHQSAGRGRAGRTWVTPPRAALAVSILLRPDVPPDRLGWLPLLAGTAVVRAITGDDGGHTGALAVKWPNDVLVRTPEPVAGLGRFRKVAGILAEVVPGTGTSPDAPAAVVLGIGLNVSQTTDELPVETGTSLGLAGLGEFDRTPLLAALLREVVAAVGHWEKAGGDPESSGLAAECTAMSATIGARVRADLAGGAGAIEGTASRLDATGGLVIRDDQGTERTVTAGDVHHLRRA